MLPTRPSDYRGEFRTDPDACAVYSESAGIMRIMPSGVAIPDDAEDLRVLVRWAAHHRVPLVPRGSGSSMGGGAVGPGVVVDLHRFRSPCRVDPHTDRLLVGASVTRARADGAARAHGLRFPVDPSSGAFATIGGMVATNAAGASSLKFGATRHWVRSLDCVFADGTRARISRDAEPPVDGPVLARWRAVADSIRARCRALEPRQVRKDASGYGVHDFAASGQLVDLLAGSEGTLAFVAEAELDLCPLPVATASLLSAWPSLEHAVHGAALAREGDAVACELLDGTFLRVAARGRTLPVAADAACVLLAELEAREDAFARARAEALGEAWRRAGASSVMLGLDPESEEALWGLRHAASPILSRLDPHVRSMQVVEDGCVPPVRLADYVVGVRRALADAGFEGVLFGHAGDAHVHVNALVDVRTPDWTQRVRGLFADVVELTRRLGGTMSGEHGDGRLRTPTLPVFWPGDALAIFADLKATFDPEGILNPEVKVPPGRDPFAHIRYDPANPLPSARAAAVLQQVEAARAYDTCRLEMLDATG